MNAQLIRKLQELVQFHVDAVYAYETAMERTSDEKAARLLESFRDDHVEHALELSSIIYGYGGKPPKTLRDWKGFLLESATLLRSAHNTEEALRAIRLVEIFTNRIYQDLLALNLPNELREVIEANQGDEGEHLDRIELKIEELKASETHTAH